MQAALQQNLLAAQFDRLPGFSVAAVLVALEHVAFQVTSGWTIERAEVADRRADVRVVDVAIDVVGAIRLRVKAFGHLIRRATKCSEVVAFQQRKPLVLRQPFASDGFIQQFCNP